MDLAANAWLRTCSSDEHTPAEADNSDGRTNEFGIVIQPPVTVEMLLGLERR
jgi:hypothetical protein